MRIYMQNKECNFRVEPCTHHEPEKPVSGGAEWKLPVPALSAETSIWWWTTGGCGSSCFSANCWSGPYTVLTKIPGSESGPRVLKKEICIRSGFTL